MQKESKLFIHLAFCVTQEDEIKREAEARRREKQEDLAARKKILEQIERDKEDRRKRLMQGSVAATPAKTVAEGPKPPTTAPSGPSKDYNEARLQIRLVHMKHFVKAPRGTSACHVIQYNVVNNNNL